MMFKWLKKIFNPCKPNTHCFDTMIGPGTVFTGNLNFAGCLHNHGTILNGSISTTDSDQNSTLIVSSSGKIECDIIDVPHLILEGEVTAEFLRATQTVIIKKTAIVTASKISTRNISIENGAIINCGSISNTVFEDNLED